ncbi:MAG: CHRD domain-containing protein [Actinomycetota bacterium]|nr:CHRD domain-containing protein [Actinomycetota bacterium]
MLRPRLAVPVVLVVAAVAAAGVAAATRHTQSTQAAAADFAAGSVSRSHTTTCTASDGTYQFTTATYTGTATSSDPRLNGTVEIRSSSVVNTTTKLGWLDGTLRIRGTNAGSKGRIHAAIANGAAVGSLVGEGTRPTAKLVASLSGAFTPATGFAAASKIGSGSANGAGVLYTRGDCRKPKQGPSTAVFHLRLTPGEVVPHVAGLNAEGTGNLTLDLTRDASGNVTGGNVVFYVNYRFPGSVTITGLALHQGARGANGPVALDAAVGTITDTDGRGNLTKVVSGASATLLQALLTSPHGYYVDLTTSANTGGALRDQLGSPDRR